MASIWFESYGDSTRKAVALDLILGGFEIGLARDFCGLKKMPMQYYMQVRGARKPKLGTTQRGLGLERIRGALRLMELGAVPEEVLLLGGVALQSLLRTEFPLPPPGRKRRSRKRKEEVEGAEKPVASVEPEAPPPKRRRGRPKRQ